MSAPPPKQAPVGALPSSNAYIATRMPIPTEKGGTDLKGTYFGSAGAQGSVAVGAMFGLIGALANVAHIESKNRSNAEPLVELSSMNLADTLREQLSDDMRSGAGWELIRPTGAFFHAFANDAGVSGSDDPLPTW